MAKIALTGKWGEGKFAIVDRDDLARCLEWNWRVGKNGYVYPSHSAADSPLVPLAHFILGVKPSRELWMDHINRNKLDNRKRNLRLVTPQESLRNRGPYRLWHWAVRPTFVKPDSHSGELRGWKVVHPEYEPKTFQTIEQAKEYLAACTKGG